MYKWVWICRHNTRLAFSLLVPCNHLSLQKHYKFKTQACLFLAMDIIWTVAALNTGFIYQCKQLYVMDFYKGSQWYSVVRLSYLVSAVLILPTQSVKMMFLDVDHSLNCSLLHFSSFYLLGCSHPPVFFHLLQAISNYGTWIWQADARSLAKKVTEQWSRVHCCVCAMPPKRAESSCGVGFTDFDISISTTVYLLQ